MKYLKKKKTTNKQTKIISQKHFDNEKKYRKIINY